MKHLAILAMIYAAATFTVAGQAFSSRDFENFTAMRIGNGPAVYWYCVGEVYEYPSGKLVAKVEGIDTARLLTTDSTPLRKLQLSRKIFFYRDPKTNEIMRESNGMKVEPIAYPYQKITYELIDGKVKATVVQGKQPRIQTIESAGEFYVRRLGGNTIFSTPLFLNFPGYKAYENYDFFYAPAARSASSRYQLTWNRRGSLPAFFGGGDSVFQLVSYRVDDYRKLPKSMRDALESNGRLWMNPPKDLKEIEELQKS
ncbi:MAG: DUF1838 family protein [Acidobacteria bacterium]|nr:DUF1838 family protein [Acidobacteriota bacterium]